MKYAVRVRKDDLPAAGTQLWIQTSTGCSPAFTVALPPPCPPRGVEEGPLAFVGGSNTAVFYPPADSVEFVGGMGNGCILIYTDDCSGNHPLVNALDDMGLAYLHYFQNPLSFDAMVGSDVFPLILVDHSCYHDLSYAWGGLVAAYQGGACVAVASYDWDGSDDASGAVSSLLALGGAAYSYDITTQGTVHVWNPSPLFTGLPSMLSAAQSFYLDEGDGWTYATAEGGWTPAPQSGEGTALIGQKLVLLGFLPDQLSLSDGTTLWRNVVDYLTSGGPTPTIPTTWGAIKQRYR